MPKPPIRFALRPVSGAAVFCMLAAALLAGCASKNPLMEEPAPSAAAPGAADGVTTTRDGGLFSFLRPYRPDIQQGNFVSEEMVAQLKPGMTPDQVRFLLGTPLLTDIFHASRWDYPFRLKKGNGEITTSRVTVYFKDNRVDHVEGGNLPTEKDYLARLAGSKPPKPVTAAPAPERPPRQPAPGTSTDPSNR